MNLLSSDVLLLDMTRDALWIQKKICPENVGQHYLIF